MDPIKKFKCDVQRNIEGLAKDSELLDITLSWIRKSNRHGYTYNYSWLGRPIIQYPQDIVAMQELIWSVKPDLIIETGVAHGGSLVFSASMLALLDMCEGIELGSVMEPAKSNRKVIGVDVDIRSHNREAIEAHPMASRIEMVQGSSISRDVIEQVYSSASGYDRILVCLDSNHTHDHVLAELEAYAPLVTPGSYCVVFDTLIEDMPGDMFHDRPWGVGDNPKTAVHAYLKSHPEFQVDRAIQHKLMITVAPDGYLRRIV